MRTDGHWSDEVFAHTALNELLVTCVCFRGVFGLRAKGLEFQGLEFRLSSLAFRFRRLEFGAPECPGERERERERPGVLTDPYARESERERESVCVCVCVLRVYGCYTSNTDERVSFGSEIPKSFKEGK